MGEMATTDSNLDEFIGADRRSRNEKSYKFKGRRCPPALVQKIAVSCGKS